jgi:Protein of unknown function (DUF3617)
VEIALSNARHAFLLHLFCTGAVATFIVAGAARAEGIQAGSWKVVTRAEVNGVAGPDQEAMRCLTPEDVEHLDVTFSPNSRTTNSTCEEVEHEMTPARLKWRLKCSGQLDMDVAGEFTFDAPDHYTATITTQASMMGKQIQQSRASIEAQRVGACQ